jgi:hypothetical protein
MIFILVLALLLSHLGCVALLYFKGDRNSSYASIYATTFCFSLAAIVITIVTLCNTTGSWR